MRDALIVLLVSMSPIGELRASIPLGIVKYGLPLYVVIPLSITGNLVPVLFLLLFLPFLSSIILRLPLIGILYGRWLESLRRRHEGKFYKYGVYFLIPFVALPFPATGAWTGSILAWIFDVNLRRAFPLISLGVLIACLIVTLLTLGGIELGGLLGGIGKP